MAGAEAKVETKTVARPRSRGEAADQSCDEEERSGQGGAGGSARGKAGEEARGAPPRQRQRARGRRVAREGEDDQEVPRLGLHREGVGRPREGSAQEEARRRHRERLRARVRGDRGQEEGRSRRSRKPRENATQSSSRPTPIAKARRSPGTSPRRSRPSNTNIQRVLFNEITKKASSRRSASRARSTCKKFDAQQARRILDRLVGYQISPILWNKVQRGLSAGRVQSVAVRLVCEREDEIKAFKPRGVLVGRRRHVEGENPPPFDAPGRAHRRQEGRAEATRAEAREAVDAIRGGDVARRPASRRRSARRPPAPFITSQAAAGRGAQAALLAPSARWRSRSASTKVSSSATRARSVSSRTCVPTRRASPTTR